MGKQDLLRAACHDRRTLPLPTLSRFRDVQGPTKVDRIVASHWEGDVLSFTTQNPNDPSDKTIYRLTSKDKNDVQLKIEGVPLPPLTFVR